MARDLRPGSTFFGVLIAITIAFGMYCGTFSWTYGPTKRSLQEEIVIIKSQHEDKCIETNEWAEASGHSSIYQFHAILKSETGRRLFTIVASYVDCIVKVAGLYGILQWTIS